MFNVNRRKKSSAIFAVKLHKGLSNPTNKSYL